MRRHTIAASAATVVIGLGSFLTFAPTAGAVVDPETAMSATPNPVEIGQGYVVSSGQSAPCYGDLALMVHDSQDHMVDSASQSPDSTWSVELAGLPAAGNYTIEADCTEILSGPTNAAATVPFSYTPITLVVNAPASTTTTSPSTTVAPTSSTTSSTAPATTTTAAAKPATAVAATPAFTG